MRMPTLTLRQKRLVVAIYFPFLILAIGIRLFEWHIFGRGDRVFYAVVILVAILGLPRFIPKMNEEAAAEQAALRQAEEAAELARDKSADAAASERLRRDIGMPPNTSF